MAKPKGKYHSNVSFLDLLFNLVVGFVMLFIIAFLLIRPIAENKQIEQKAEYIISVTWPKEFHDDVDTWLQDPAEQILSFRSKEVGLMHLDRDDLGRSNDSQYIVGIGKVTYPYNREIATIRGYLPGEYVLNIHLYRKVVLVGGAKPVPVTITVEKINPKVKLIYKAEMILDKQWEEKTVIRFVLNRDGEVVDTNFLYYPLVKKKIAMQQSNYNTPNPGDIPNNSSLDTPGLSAEENFH
jgi:hypothetical protein